MTFLTDNLEFPSKRVTFDLWIPATGSHMRSVSIGSFAPEAVIDISIPTKSFSQGSVTVLSKSASGAGSINVQLASAPQKQVLTVRGSAPTKVGEFKKEIELEEWFPDQPALGKGTLDLDLVGRVLARWTVPPGGFYAGFVPLDGNQGTINLSIERNSAVAIEKHRVSDISLAFSEDWLTLERFSAQQDRIQLAIDVNVSKVRHLGPVQSSMDVTIKYSDGSVENFSTKLFAYLKR